MHQLGDAGRGDRDSVFVVLDLGRDTDAHDDSSMERDGKSVKNIRAMRNKHEDNSLELGYD
jgi:hypothetical protein